MTEQNGLERSSATERISAMLDELRKLACDINEEEIRSHSVITSNQGRYNRQFRLDMNHDWLNAWHAELERILQAIEATLGETPTPPPPTPPKQPPYDELIESLRRDWDIEASWDGLRRFWYVGLTDEGVRKRDEREATLGRGECEVEAENAKLRDLALNCYRMAKAHCTDKDCRTRCSHWPECCEHDSLQHAEPCELAVLACELGIEVDA